MIDNRLDVRFYRLRGPLKLSEILQGLSAVIVEGQAQDVEILKVAPLMNSGEGDLVFLDNRKHVSLLDSAQASACFVKKENMERVAKAGIIPILSDYPRAHFARAQMKLYTVKAPDYSTAFSSRFENNLIHPTAIISSDADIADTVEIGPYSVIGAGVRLESGTRVGSHVDIQCALIGKDCVIKSGSVIGGAGFGVTHDETGVIDIPHFGRVILGNRVSIGSQTCIDRGQLGDTQIGNDTKIDNLVQIAHNVVIGKSCAIAGHSGISGSVTLGDFVMLGGSVGLADHVTIGDKASVAARSGVMHNIPAGETWFGTPAQPIREQMRMISRMRKLTAKPVRNARGEAL